MTAINKQPDRQPPPEMSHPLHTLQAAFLMILLVLLPAGTRSQEGSVDTENNSTIYCYQCNSGMDSDCSTLQANSTQSPYYKPCEEYADYKSNKPFCRKIVQTIFEREMVRVIRKCGWERHERLDCYYSSNDDHTETVCQCFTDGCNGAPRTAISAAMISSILALTYILVS